jgi:hypothetical protein
VKANRWGEERCRRHSEAHNKSQGAQEAYIIVPDDVETVPVAVKSAAYVQGGEDPVGVFVRKGLHRWDGDIFLHEKWILDIPPMSEVTPVFYACGNLYVLCT